MSETSDMLREVLDEKNAQLAAAQERVEGLEKDVKELDDKCNDQHSSLTHINWKISLLESRIAQRDAEITRMIQGVRDWINRRHKYLESVLDSELARTDEGQRQYWLGAATHLHDLLRYLDEDFDALVPDAAIKAAEGEGETL